MAASEKNAPLLRIAGRNLSATSVAEVFTVSAGIGSASISAFDPKQDGLVLKNLGFTSYAGFLAALSQTGADTVLTLANGESLTLRNVRIADLSIANIALDRALPESGAATAWFKASSAGGQLAGTSGNDQLSTSFTTGTLAGGQGDDVYCVSSQDVSIVEVAGQGIDTVKSWAKSYTLSATQSVENLLLQGTGDIAGTGNALDNLIVGNEGRNVLAGGRGNDVLTGGGGSDTFVVQAGDGTDVVTDFQAKGAAADILRIERYGYASLAELRPKMVQAGADVMIWLSDKDAVTLKNTALADLTEANFGFLSTQRPMTLTGTAGKDTLVGGMEGDTLTGKAGDDTLTGGGGSDLFVIAQGDGSDTITDFSAGDRLKLSGSAFANFAELRAAWVASGSDLRIALGGGDSLSLKNVAPNAVGADQVIIDYTLATSGATTSWISQPKATGTVLGTSANDKISVGVAGGTLKGGLGDDIYSIVAGVTVVEQAGGGIDTVQVWTGEGYALADNIENLTLMGSSAGWIRGNGLANIMEGNGADNIIVGGRGNDILTGGGGSDRFVVAKGDGSDFITDFSTGAVGRDVVRLDGFGFKSFAEVAARMSQSGADSVLDLGGGATLTLRGTSLSNLTAEHFALPLDTSALVRTFRDDFSSFSRASSGDGTWMTQFTYGGAANYTLSANAEEQLYVDRDFKGLPQSLSSASLGLDPFSIQDGTLVISAKPVTEAARPYTGKYGWTSGLITTQSSLSQTYGYFEITAELPQVKGSWPAFWLLPADNSGTSELDVFEYLGSRTDTVVSSVHAQKSLTAMTWLPVEDLAAGKHTFGAKWTPYGIDIFIDGTLAAHHATPDDMSKPMYMLANLAMGGSWGGSPDAGATAQLKIDAINAYQLEEYTLAGYRLKTGETPTKTLYGTSASETLTGTDGADALDGRGGVDALVGGRGDDTYVVTQAGTVVTERLGEGIDTVTSQVSFTLSANIENLTLLGSGAIDATGNANANILTGNAGGNVLNGAGGNDVLTGGGGADTFVLRQGDGSDIITDFAAGPGAGDTVKLDGFWFTSFTDIASSMTQHGGDVYLALNTSETLVFRDHHVADFAADDFRLPEAPPASEAPIRWIIGTTAAESLSGTPLDEALQGMGGQDSLAGGAGDDTYTVAVGTTVVERAGEGVDTAESWLSAYTLTNHVENLALMLKGAIGTGNDLTNRITGSAGDDRIDGKGGNDWLTGGEGKDSFVFSTALDGARNVDTITDFKPRTDVLLLSADTFAGIGAKGALAASAFETATAAHDAADRIVYDRAAGDLSFDADGSGAGAAVKFAHVTPGLALSASDFLII
ncbi:family 16 glycosylhydrolase [Methylobacterium sp. R2-1]|uniref:family 16 glycosylhydrolase n=1 Tax=Methylobacterium sp. R2-1 TaxID=2587064 RepID=UPI0016153FE7|nr:family 16 glycosylhydrolase [Methylobacterium sp. R2-1]MBB2964901.1 Ca2+-binding RTX toxin-like protein [Methylobacterium sp. R2-1]